MVSYYRFLITKFNFKDIKHRKIVQIIFNKYIPEKYDLLLDWESLKTEN